MDIAATAEAAAAAAAYEELHVPALFKPWAPLVVKAAKIGSGDRVLDVACGTGVLTREVSNHVGESGFIAGVDVNPGMLSIARKLAPAIEWKQGLAEALPYADGSFDVVTCQFGLMFFNDRLTALREMLRVLVPGGRIVVAVWGSLESTKAIALEVELLDKLGGKTAGDALRAPFVLGDEAKLSAILREAGVDRVQVVTQTSKARYPSIKTLVSADLRGWLPVMGVELQEEVIESILKEAEQTLAEFVVSDGTVEFDAPGLIATGRKA